MGKFSEAFERGAASAKVAERNLAEISRILQDVSDEIVTATAGGVTAIRIQSNTKRVADRNIFLINPLGPGGKEVKYDSIVAVNADATKNPHSAELCEISRSVMGFPVVLVYANRSVSCADGDAFRQELVRLLEHPQTAEMIEAVWHGATETSDSVQ